MPRTTQPPIRLTTAELARGARWLARRDPVLRRLRQAHGDPPLWERAPGFETLVHLILEQQVSLASARAALEKLRTACRGRITPRRVLAFDDARMKALGFSRQKTGYTRALAEAMLSGQFDPGALEALDDAAAHAALVQLKGIGRWTADNYLLMDADRQRIADFQNARGTDSACPTLSVWQQLNLLAAVSTTY